LRHLPDYLNRKLLVIWDRLNIHRAEEVKTPPSCGWARLIHIEEFSAYAPDLNPDEGVWHHLKHYELRNLRCVDLDHLDAELTLAIKRMRLEPELIRSFFAEAKLDLCEILFSDPANMIFVLMLFDDLVTRFIVVSFIKAEMLWFRTRRVGPFNNNRIQGLCQQFVIVHIGGCNHDR
jgi:hypothetical protein